MLDFRNLLCSLFASRPLHRRQIRRDRLSSSLFLEQRILLASTPIQITIDYSYDTNGFFDPGTEDGAAARAQMELAASMFEARVWDDLGAIDPSGSNSWSIVFNNPSTGSNVTINNPEIAANEIIIYAGARNIGSLGSGGPGGWSASGSSAWLNTVSSRGEAGALGSGGSQTDFAPWGGTVTFDSAGVDWNFSSDPPSFGQSDFYSVAVHEIAHVLGIGTANSFENLVSGSVFTGAMSTSIYGGTNPPLANDDSHWASGTMSYLLTSGQSQEAAMDPEITQGTRKYFTELDFAALDDLGWDVQYPVVNEPPSVQLTNEVETLPENTSTATRVKVADIVITDDGNGTNSLSLSGSDSSLFEILGNELFLKAGTTLNATTNPVLDVTVNVDDTAVGSTPDFSDSLSIVVTAASTDIEPNNSPAQAIDLGVVPFNLTRSGNIHRTNDRLDTYRFEVAAGTMADVEISLGSLTANTTLRLYRLEGNQIVSLVGQSFNGGTASELIQSQYLVPGEYLIEVVLDSSVGASISTGYQLSVAGVTSVLYSDSADNSAAQATDLGTVIPSGSLEYVAGSYLNRTTDRLDTYRFEIGAGHLADVSISLDALTQNTSLRLYRLQGNTIVSLVAQSAQPGTLEEIINADALAPGEYLIEVVMDASVAANQQTGYRLQINVESSVLATENPNDASIAGATSLGTATPASPVDVYLASSLHKTNDRADNYRFQIGSGQLANVNLHLDSFTADTTLRLYRLQGNTIVSLVSQSVAAGVSPESINAFDLLPGEYLIEVVLGSSVAANVSTPYRLHVEVETSVEFTENSTDASAAGATFIGTYNGAASLEKTYASTLNHNSDRVDTYRFQIAGGQTADVNLLLDYYTTITNLRVYRLSGNSIVSLVNMAPDGWAAQKSLNLVDLVAGDYLIEIVLPSNVSPAVTTNYRLQLSMS